MQPHARSMHLPRAIITSVALLVASSGLIMFGDEATDPAVIAGAVGIVVAAALLGLTALAARWRGGAVRYITTSVDTDALDVARPVEVAFGTAVGTVVYDEDSAAI